ncbi:MAG: hypothetical protein JNL11_14945 [Bdellovibrionaceae bacterium]|nr:hypothetical protein [Pseudobdellovibrionaceae bacterium]
MMPNFDSLGEMIRNIHTLLSQLFFVALPVGILISVVIGYFRVGSADYVDILRRALVASLLIISFPEVSNIILNICDGIALKIDSQSGIDTIMRLAEEKSRSYAGAKNAILLKFDDLIIAALSFLSFVILYIARYLIIALYYFFWVLLSALSPILIFFYLFPSTSGITKNLYKGLIEVASWKIIWSIQSAMLISLSLGNIYKTEGNYLTLIVLNFVIAIGMICTPLVVKSIIGEGAHGMAHVIGASAFGAMAAIPAKAQMVKTKVQTVTQGIQGNISQRIQNYQQQKRDHQKRLQP